MKISGRVKIGKSVIKSSFLRAIFYCYTILETSDHVEKDGICCFSWTFFLLLRQLQEHYGWVDVIKQIRRQIREISRCSQKKKKKIKTNAKIVKEFCCCLKIKGVHN